MTQFNPLQTIKRRFFAMRNGIVADTLRKAGSPYRIIFGLNLPQLSEIAHDTGCDTAMAETLLADNHTRESQLLAPMIADPATIDHCEATRWADAMVSAEAIDVLCLKLLRRMPDPVTTAIRWATEESPESAPLRKYAGIRLMWNLIPQHSASLRPVAAEIARNGGDTAPLAARLMEEIDFLAGE
ncbi:MAG: hypothetical protein K2H99_03450 [Paramuribaculum sp.]|nr:hypothetical protein [Paramuribaculum sp.]